jgi:hypothetical protein
MRNLVRFGIPLVALVALTSVGEAQRQARTVTRHRPHIGPHIGYDFDAEAVLLGAQFSAPISRRVEFYPSFDYYFTDPGSLWQLNADLKYQLRESGHWFYLGGGLGIAHRQVSDNSATKLGVNLLGGIEALVWQRVHPYFEARGFLSDNSRFQLAAGLNITIY